MNCKCVRNGAKGIELERGINGLLLITSLDFLVLEGFEFDFHVFKTYQESKRGHIWLKAP